MRDVTGGGISDLLESLICEDRVRETPIGGIRLAANQSPPLEAAHYARQVRQRDVGVLSQHAHPPRAVRAIREHGEDLVLDHCEVGIALELLIDRPGQRGHQAHDR